MNRRQAVTHLMKFFAASPLLRADRKYSDLQDPVYEAVNVMDMGRLAKKKLDPLAWDYLDEGSEMKRPCGIIALASTTSSFAPSSCFTT